MAFKKDKAATAFDVGRYDSKALERDADYAQAATTGLSVNTALNTKTTEVPIAGSSHQAINYYVDGTDSLANRGLTINLVHVPTSKGVRFKAFLMAFNESYSSDWSSESVYGRADPIHMFKQTSRNISLAWKIVAATESEAVENLVRLQSFLQMLYPTYTEKNQAQTINQSPLIRLQMSNMIRKSATPHGLTDLRSGTTAADLGTGLLGIIKSVSVTHNMENPDIGVLELGPAKSGARNNIVPKAIEVQMDFSVVHEHMLGWTKTGTTWTFGGGSVNEAAFPYYVADATGRSIGTANALRAMHEQAWKDSVDKVNDERTSYATTANELAQYSETIGAAFQAAGVDATTVEGTAQVALVAAAIPSGPQGTVAAPNASEIREILGLPK